MARRLEASRNNIEKAFWHLGELLTGQIAYHQDSVNQYSCLSRHLNNWYTAMFYAGFVIVVLRAFLQFYMSGHRLDFELPLVNRAATQDFVSSFVNMLALLLPDWASYFESKNSLCNFGFNVENHKTMRALLENELDNYNYMESKMNTRPSETLRIFGESITEIMLVKDTAPCARKYAGTNIKPL